MSNRAKIEAIRNDRERHFASVFFDHDEWESQPAPIRFKGGAYRPDFFDYRRGIYIEVVGTRQAFDRNRYKYLYLLEIRKDIKLEFRTSSGDLLNPYHLRLKKCKEKPFVVLPKPKTELERYRRDHELTFKQLSVKVGVKSVSVVYAHCMGTRKMCAENAVAYSNTLGIPRSELRPDLWPPATATPATPRGGEDAA